ncbi:MAG: chemotaxis protein CheA [Candidatus Obscuribacterales bacterium]|nr:chemotaxis protein CheA [Steroidobacteraceae bacterium]
MALDLAQFHDVFFEESFEALDSMEAALLKLNSGSPDKELINTVFRVAHSIKGGSATFGFSEVASFTHTLETLLDELRAGKMQVTRVISDLLLKSVDVMRDMLRAVQNKTPIDAQRVADLQFDLELSIVQKPSSEVPKVIAPVDTQLRERVWRIDFLPLPQLFIHGNDPLRMMRELVEIGSLEARADIGEIPEFAELDAESCYLGWQLTLRTNVTRETIAGIFDWAEGDCELTISELPSSSTQASQLADGMADSRIDAKTLSNVVAIEVGVKEEIHSGLFDNSSDHARSTVASGESSSIRVSIEKIDELMNSVGELVITQSMLGQLGARMEGEMAAEFRTGLVQLERNVRELQESVMRVRMLPISFVFSRFPRMVRDLSQRLGKQVELRVTGDQTELDKTVLEKIGDPLTHLVRNCIDHGIELPAVRIAADKSPIGTVFLDAYHKGGAITVEVGDDGGGLDKDRIIAKARARGLIGADDILSQEQAYELIFVAGFSTVDKTTDISGRGVGMDVVRRNVKELGGSIELRSELGKGSRFVINLPLTLAIVDGQSVAVGAETYIVPLTTIIESLQLKPSMTNCVVGHGEVFNFRDDYLPVIRLHELFGVEPRTRALHEGLLMIVEGDGHRVGLFVDDLLGQQQVVVKSLETNFRRIDGVSGATILGDGSVALILDVPGLIRVAAERMAA